jgi:hypothetical protein
MYLISGTTDTEEVYFKVGKMNLILDNLIAEGKAKEMILVLPYGNATLLKTERQPQQSGRGGMGGMGGFGGMGGGYNFNADFGYKGFGFIILLYALRHTKVVQAILGCCLLPSDWLGGLAFIPINMYNGKRGFIQGKWGKYFFYAFYPVHLFILYLIKWC